MKPAALSLQPSASRQLVKQLATRCVEWGEVLEVLRGRLCASTVKVPHAPPAAVRSPHACSSPAGQPSPAGCRAEEIVARLQWMPKLADHTAFDHPGARCGPAPQRAWRPLGRSRPLGGQVPRRRPTCCHGRLTSAWSRASPGCAPRSTRAASTLRVWSGTPSSIARPRSSRWRGATSCLGNPPTALMLPVGWLRQGSRGARIL